MPSLFSDFRQSWRSLLRNPGFTLPLLLVLTLGLGSSIAFHGMLQRLLLRPLPVPRPSEIHALENANARPGASFGSYLQFKDVQAALPDIPMTALEGRDLILHDLKQRPLRLGQFASPEFFPMLGLKAHLGDVSLKGSDPTVVISYALWKEVFQGSPRILGSLMRVQDQTLTIVGVAPKGFSGLYLGAPADLWIPLACLPRFEADPESREQMFTQRNLDMFLVYARIPQKRQASFQGDLKAIHARLSAIHPEDKNDSWKSTPLNDIRKNLAKDFLPDQAFVFGATLLGLLLTSVGAASLMMARSERKGREWLLRGALGADKWALARPLIAESLILTLMALPLALVTGYFLGEHLLSLPQNTHMEAAPLHMDLGGWVVPTALLLLLGVMGISVLIPLRRCLRMDLATALRLDSVQGGQSQRRHWLISLQVALSLTLLAASSVALTALHKGAQVGYDLKHKAYIQFAPRLAGQAVDQGLPNRMLEEARRLPGVRSVALGAAAPLDAMEIKFTLTTQEGRDQNYPVSFVGPQWFETLGVRMIEGREFRDSDPKSAAILSQSMARQIWPQANTYTGRYLPKSKFEVVGVVADHRQRVDKEIQQPMLFLTRGYWGAGQTALLVATHGSEAPLPAMLRSLLEQQAPGLPPLRAYTLEDQLDLVLRQERQNLHLLGLLGLGSLTLACFSLWAALNLQVALRRRELGIRAALGASLSQLMNTVLSRGARLLALGLAGGLTLTWIMVKLGRWQWPRMPELSPWNLATAALTLMAAGLLACLIPALKAARVDPAEALRDN